MAIPNFNSKPGGPGPVMGQDVLSSGVGTVAPQQQSKPYQLPQQQAHSIGGEAQNLAHRMLPDFNNGNPRGANNMGRYPYQSPEEQRIRQQAQDIGADDNWLHQQLSRLQGYGDEDPFAGARGVGRSRQRQLPHLNWPIDTARGNAQQGGQGGETYEDYLRNGPHSMAQRPEGTMGPMVMPMSREQWERRQGGGYRDNSYRPMPEFQGHYGNPGGFYFGGQDPRAGRYRPPTQDSGGNWNDYGGYNYNLPNAFGSYPGYSQGNPYSWMQGPGMDSMFAWMPQFRPGRWG